MTKQVNTAAIFFTFFILSEPVGNLVISRAISCLNRMYRDIAYWADSRSVGVMRQDYLRRKLFV